MSHIIMVDKMPKCCFCNEEAWIAMPQGNICLEHWLSNISWDVEPPFLRTGAGQLRRFSCKTFDPEISLKKLQKEFGNDERYTLLIRGNAVIETQTRRYGTLEKEPNRLSCILDIATRLLPGDSDKQQGGIKIWLQKARGGQW